MNWAKPPPAERLVGRRLDQQDAGPGRDGVRRLYIGGGLRGRVHHVLVVGVVPRHPAHRLDDAQRRRPGQAAAGVEYPQVMPDGGGSVGVHDDDRAAPAVQPPRVQLRQPVRLLQLPRRIAIDTERPYAPLRRRRREVAGSGGNRRCCRGQPDGLAGAGGRPPGGVAGLAGAVTARLSPAAPSTVSSTQPVMAATPRIVARAGLGQAPRAATVAGQRRRAAAEARRAVVWARVSRVRAVVRTRVSRVRAVVRARVSRARPAAATAAAIARRSVIRAPPAGPARVFQGRAARLRFPPGHPATRSRAGPARRRTRPG